MSYGTVSQGGHGQLLCLENRMMVLGPRAVGHWGNCLKRLRMQRLFAVNLTETQGCRDSTVGMV